MWLDTSIEYKDGCYLLRTSNDETNVDETLSLALDSSEYFEWLARLKAFRFVGQQGTFTARQERIIDSAKNQHGTQYWYAYRKIKSTQVKRYLGKTSNAFSIEFLEESARLIEESLKKKLGVADLPAAGAQNLKERVAEQELTIAELHGQVETLQAYVATLEGQLHAIEEKREKRVVPKQDELPPAGFI